MKKRGKRVFWLFVTVLMGVLLLLVLTAGSTKEKVTVEEWVIPHLAPLSGPYAGFGIECMWACQYALWGLC